MQARARPRDEAEKPFWISYADLMTALMVLFLVVMAVALLAVTKTISDEEKARAQHDKEIQTLLDRFEAATKQEQFHGITIDRNRRVIDFGSRAQFPFAKSTLTPEQQKLLRAFVPKILEKINDDLARKVLKEIVVDGYTDKKGTYLSNLDLSLQRSQRVMCTLFARPNSDEHAIAEEQLEQIRKWFVVGGYSFNAQKATDEESRRIEMRLQFRAYKETIPEATGNIPSGNFGTCALPG